MAKREEEGAGAGAGEGEGETTAQHEKRLSLAI